jgi:hypothetical protein
MRRAHGQKGQLSKSRPPAKAPLGAASGTMLAKTVSMDSRDTAREAYFYEPTNRAVDEGCAEQARRRAARWHAWLKSPECTFQDRENFERWCADEGNAAAYVAWCGDLAAVPECANGLAEEVGRCCADVFTLSVNPSQLEADRR